MFHIFVNRPTANRRHSRRYPGCHGLPLFLTPTNPHPAPAVKDEGNSTKVETEADVTGQFAVGAEEERARMEALLDKRRRLLGKGL